MKKMLWALLLLVPSATWAQAASPAPAFSTAGAFFALSVPDLDASARWYVEKLGLRVVLRPPKYETTSVAILEGGGLIVELIQDDAAVPLRTAAPAITQPTRVHGVVKVGVVVEDVDRTLATLRQRGVEIAMGPFPAREGQRANFLIHDNAANLLQFFGR